MRSLQGTILTLLLLIGLNGCSAGTAGSGLREGDEAFGLVHLDLQVDASLLSGALTRAEEQVPDAEKVHTLRVIIVRPSGLVEHNTLTKVNPGQEYLFDLMFSVKGGEKKTIYLIANENASRIIGGGAETWRFVKYDFDGIKTGDAMPGDALDALMELPESGEAILSEVPMTHVETFDMPEKDASRSMKIERAVTKFTLVIENGCAVSRKVDSIMVHKVSRKSYLMPHKTLDGFLMPESLLEEDYFTYVHEVKKTLEGGARKTLESFYLLESQYKDPYDTRNYRMVISVDGNLYEQYFPDMSVLQRGEHVVVNIKINESSLDAEVFPWGTYILMPVFGH